MKKSKIFIIVVILSLIASIALVIYDGYNYAPTRIRYNYRYIESEKIHPDLDGLQIAFFSDLHYLSFTEEKRLENIIERINNVNADVLIFLGDLIAKELDETQTDILENNLKQLKADYGKFAILGEDDYQSESINTAVESVLYNADFELLKNQKLLLSKNSKHAIQLVGIDSPLDDKANIELAYSDVDEKLFTLTIVHTPDTVKELPQNKTDLVLAGHSHGGQIKIPLLGQIYNKELAEDYYTGLYSVNLIKLYVSHGVGLTNKDVRINAPAEIVIYTLKSK